MLFISYLCNFKLALCAFVYIDDIYDCIERVQRCKAKENAAYAPDSNRLQEQILVDALYEAEYDRSVFNTYISPALHPYNCNLVCIRSTREDMKEAGLEEFYCIVEEFIRLFDDDEKFKKSLIDSVVPVLTGFCHMTRLCGDEAVCKGIESIFEHDPLHLRLRKFYNIKMHIGDLNFGTEEKEMLLQVQKLLNEFYSYSNRFVDVLCTYFAPGSAHKENTEINKDIMQYYRCSVGMLLNATYYLTKAISLQVKYDLTDLLKTSEMLLGNYQQCMTYADERRFYIENVRDLFDLYIVFNGIFEKIQLTQEGKSKSNVLDVQYPYDVMMSSFTTIDYKEVISDHDPHAFCMSNNLENGISDYQQKWFEHMHKLYRMLSPKNKHEKREYCIDFVDNMIKNRNYFFTRHLFMLSVECIYFNRVQE